MHVVLATIKPIFYILALTHYETVLNSLAFEFIDHVKKKCLLKQLSLLEISTGVSRKISRAINHWNVVFDNLYPGTCICDLCAKIVNYVTQLFQAGATVHHCLTSFKVKIQLDHFCIGDRRYIDVYKFIRD